MPGSASLGRARLEDDPVVAVGHEPRFDRAPAAERALGAAQDVDLGDERVQVGERLRRRSLDRPDATPVVRRAHGLPEDEQEQRPDAQEQDGEDAGRDRRLGPLDQARRQQAERPEAERRDDQDDIAAEDVVGGDPAEDEHDGRQRDRRRDQQADVDERAEQLADDHGQRRDRRDDEQLERLLLAFLADRAGGRGRCEERDLERLEHQQRREDALADRRPMPSRPSPPKPEVKLRSMISSTIHAKPARSTR